MMKKGRTGTLYLVVLIAILAISILYGNYRIEKQRVRMQGEIDKAMQKAEMVQRRYVEQKAVSESLQRMQISLEGKKSALQAELSKTKEALTKLEGDFTNTGNIYAKCIEDFKRLSDEKKGLEVKLKEEVSLLAKTKKEQDEFVARLKSESEERISELDSSLKSFQSRLENCIKKNARLCIIADELLKRYEDKGVISAIMSKEPVTQMERVELEKLVQEYREEINKQKEKKNN
jgi:chromosome segregation ATPase